MNKRQRKKKFKPAITMMIDSINYAMYIGIPPFRWTNYKCKLFNKRMRNPKIAAAYEDLRAEKKALLKKIEENIFEIGKENIVF